MTLNRLQRWQLLKLMPLAIHHLSICYKRPTRNDKSATYFLIIEISYKSFRYEFI